MLLREFLNEFELDWAQAPVRSGQIPVKELRGARVLLAGDQFELQEAIAWSLEAWNDEKHAGIRVAEAEYAEREAVMQDAPKLSAGEAEDSAGGSRLRKLFSGSRAKNGRQAEAVPLQIAHRFTEETFEPAQADYIILSGLCCWLIPKPAAELTEELRRFEQLVKAACATSAKRILLLSDSRVYGKPGRDFAVSEYEAGQTDPADSFFTPQYVLQALEGILITNARAAGKAYNILRVGQLYGACIPMLNHPVSRLAKKTARSESIDFQMSPDRASYISMHDFLTAVQFVLTSCPENKILNAKGLDSDKSEPELAVLLYQNFPEQCKIDLHTEAKETDAETDGILLNTQLLEHYGFVPQIPIEDGLIILVKAMQDTGEVFIFDNTYLGKLETVQKILLGYLLEIDRICKKYDIQYFLAGGTLLGAIRHHGFIPWDDDADVMMLREDYDRFQEVVQQELPDNIFMQLPWTEEGNHNPFTKLRINNTMFATEFTGHFMDMHNGIFFDVLSHDKTGNHGWSQKLHLMLTMLTRSVVFNKWGDTDIKSGGNHPIICKIVDKAKYLVPMDFAEWAQNKSLTFFKNRESDYLYDGMGRNLKRGPFPAKWLEEAVYVDFEGYQFPVPKEYHKYLTYLYGDYMQMIPVSQRRTSHSIVLTDLGEYSDFKIGKR